MAKRKKKKLKYQQEKGNTDAQGKTKGGEIQQTQSHSVESNAAIVKCLHRFAVSPVFKCSVFSIIGSISTILSFLTKLPPSTYPTPKKPHLSQALIPLFLFLIYKKKKGEPDGLRLITAYPPLW